MKPLRWKTWHAENFVVAMVLGAVVAVTGGRWVEWVGAAAVFCGFCHASISERMREREAARPVPSVECHRLATVFFLAKEAGWLVYFVALGAWSALVGCGVFLLYPLWRKLWRRWHPMVAVLALAGCGEPFVGVEEPDEGEIVFIERGAFVSPEQDVCVPVERERRAEPDAGARGAP